MSLKSIAKTVKRIQKNSQIWICKITLKNKEDSIEDWHICLMRTIKNEKEFLKEIERDFNEVDKESKIQYWICKEDKKNRKNGYAY
jgi:hypothetical protein